MCGAKRYIWQGSYRVSILILGFLVVVYPDNAAGDSRRALCR